MLNAELHNVFIHSFKIRSFTHLKFTHSLIQNSFIDMKTIIVDDESDCLAVAVILLSRHCPQVQITGAFTDPVEGLAKIRSEPPDLVLLDVEMPRLNGFELLDAAADLSFQLVLTTAYDRFAVKAFKYAAVDYLLKPIDPEELKNAVAKAEAKTAIHPQQLDLLREQLRTTEKVKVPDRIALPGIKGYNIIDTETIVYCESDDCYTHVVLQNGEKHRISKTLGDVEEALSESTFFRIHKQYLVNLRHVIEFVRGDGGYVVMRGSSTNLSIARSKREHFASIFRHF